MKKLLLLFFIGMGYSAFGQEINTLLDKTKAKLESIQEIQADVNIEIDVPYVQMPTKHATLHYRKDKSTKITSEDFLMIPKKGLDFTLEQVFKYPFITADRGMTEINGIPCKQINIIPTDTRSDFAIVLLCIDPKQARVMRSEVSTKKQGSYQSNMKYDNESAIVPSAIEVNFEMDKLKIPLSFMGKNMDIDKKALKEKGEIEGKIFIEIENAEVELN